MEDLQKNLIRWGLVGQVVGVVLLVVLLVTLHGKMSTLQELGLGALFICLGVGSFVEGLGKGIRITMKTIKEAQDGRVQG